MLALLKTRQPHEITIEQVLRESGVSSGSLYHHFKDFADLVDHALKEEYAQFGQVQISGLEQAIRPAANAAECEANLHALMRLTHAPGVAAVRIARANIVAQAAVRPNLRALLTAEQNRLTTGIADALALGKTRGWMRRDLDPRVVATFIQAYSLGRIVDDIADPGVDNDAWIALLQGVVSTFFDPEALGKSR